MAKRKRSSVEKYHDRVAGIYDTIYDGNPYWQTVEELTWRHIQRVIPSSQTIRCLDVGCGTGKWGLKLLKSGYNTDFLDISRKMLDQVEQKLDKMKPAYKSVVIHASVDDLSVIEDETYDFLIGQGDPLCCAKRPERTMKDFCRILKPGGMIMMSVDNKLGSLFHFFKDGDVVKLNDFLKNGKTNWVTDEKDEQYAETMFSPDDIRKMCDVRGLEIVSMMAKTALPLRRFQDLLKDRERRRELIRIEESLNRKEAMFGCAAHLEFVARKPAAPAQSPS